MQNQRHQNAMPAGKLPVTKLFASRAQTGEDGTAKKMVHYVCEVHR
jgi:hypothetical protein